MAKGPGCFSKTAGNEARFGGSGQKDQDSRRKNWQRIKRDKEKKNLFGRRLKQIIKIFLENLFLRLSAKICVLIALRSKPWIFIPQQSFIPGQLLLPA
jgi:hypothetical protein